MKPIKMNKSHRKRQIVFRSEGQDVDPAYAIVSRKVLTGSGHIVLVGKPGWSADWIIGEWIAHPGSGWIRIKAYKKNGDLTETAHGIFYNRLSHRTGLESSRPWGMYFSGCDRAVTFKTLHSLIERLSADG